MTTHDLDERRREELAGVLRANGITDKPAEYDSDIHSWRCAYPEQYGPCSCFAELVGDLMPLVAGWLAEAEAGIAVCTTCQHRGGDDQPAQHPGCAAALGRIRAAALREAAREAEERGDIGKPDGGTEAWVWLDWRADRVGEGA